MHLLNTLPQRLDPGATPTFAGLIATSLTSPASTNLTLGLGTGGTALTLASSTLVATFAGAVTVTPPNGTDGLRVISAGDQSNLYLETTGSTGGNKNWLITNNFNAAGNLEIRQSNSTGGDPRNAGTSRFVISPTGDVSISSTTAGASNAGALVVQGGISAGNTGSAASYFGGNVTVKSDNTKLQVEGNTASNSTQFLIKNPTTNFYVALDNSIGGSFGKPNAGVIWLSSSNKLVFATDNSPRMEISSAGDITATGAATFAGAVTIGNTVNTVSPTSPNRTITMVVGGVTLYIAAKTTND